MSDSASTAAQLVRDFFDAYGDTYADVRKSFERYLAEDCEWINPGMPTAHGLPAILELLENSHSMLNLEGTPVEILRLAASDDVVFVERVDKMMGAGGQLILVLPVVGVLEVKDGYIVRWREYADSALFASLLPGLTGEGSQ